MNNTHPGERGLTLIEKMELELVNKLRARGAFIEAIGDREMTDEEYDECLRNEGVIKGELMMLSIMRSTTPKVELERARVRIQTGQFDGK